MGMKGLILAGGKDPAPAGDFDHEQAHGAILNRPMILIRSRPCGTRRTDVMIVTGGEHIGSIAEFLGDGTEYGVRSLPRKDAGGIAQALGLAKDFVGDSVLVTRRQHLRKQKLPAALPAGVGTDRAMLFSEVKDPSVSASPRWKTASLMA